jgi:hypothetical protein
MKQPRPSLVNRPAQIKIMQPDLRLASDPKGATGTGDVGLQRDRWHVLVDRAERLPDHQMVCHIADGQLVTVAEHRPGRLGNLSQTGQRATPQAGQRFR